MKRLMYLFAAAAAVLSGCSKAGIVEKITPIDVPAKSFYCTFAANETSKTTIEQTSSTLYTVYWEANDEITVNNGISDMTFTTAIAGAGVVFTSSEDEATVEEFFNKATGFTATNNTDFSEGMNISVTEGNAKHLPMRASASASERTLSFEVTKPVIAVKIPSNVSAKSLKLVRRGESSTVVSLSSSENISVFYVPVAEATAQYNISAYSDSDHSNEIAESMKMQVAAEMTKGNIYPLDFTPTLEIAEAGDKELLSYPANYRVFITDNITGSALNIKYADGAAEHPANVYINAKNHEITSLDVNTEDSHVEIDEGSSTNVTSKTSKNTFVIKPKYEINTKLTLEKGSVVVEGTGTSANVKKIEIPAEANDVQISINTLPDGTEQSAQVEIVNNAPKEEVQVLGIKDHEYYIVEKNEVTEVKPVVMIDSVKYSSLADAFISAKNGETVTLLKDIDLTERLGISGKDISLDLKDHNITYSGATLNSGIILVNNGAALTVTGTTGSIDSGDDASAAIALTKKETYKEAYTAKITIKGGNIIGKNFGIAGNGTRHNTAIDIKGGKVSATAGPAIYNPQNGTINVSGGTIEGTEGIYMKSGAAVVATGGTIKGTGPKGDYLYDGNGNNGTGDAIVVDNCNYPGGRPSLTIDGATLISENAFQIGAYFNAPETAISDIFSSNNSLTAPSEYSWTETAIPGMYKLGKAVATIGSKKYESLEDAVNGAKAGETITLVADIPMISQQSGDIFLRFKDNVVLDLNGHTINNGVLCTTYWDYTTGNAYVFEGRGITIKNGIMSGFELSDGYCYALYVGNDEDGNIATSNVTIENITSPKGGINILNATDVAIKKCDITVSPAKYYAVSVQNDGSGSRASATIYSGTYRCGTDGEVVCKIGDNSQLSIKGGTYYADPFVYLAPGYEEYKEGNVWIVTPIVTGGITIMDRENGNE